MKACPYCGEQIQDAAVLCRFCHRSLVVQPPTPAGNSNRSAKIVLALIVGAVAVSAFFSAIGVSNESLTDKAEQAVRGTTSEVKLELLASSGRRSDGGDYMKVEGQVKNISDKPIDSIVVVTNWYSDDGTFIASDKGLVDFRPLLAGQTSPFSSLTRRNPVMSKYSVVFTTFSGAVINHRDSSK